MLNKIIVYDWPDSQLCSDCQNGEFIQSETFNSADYYCKVDCELNIGINCPEFMEKEGE